jgi:3',5'-cyclic AMP phosphodiesterase CpdA
MFAELRLKAQSLSAGRTGQSDGSGRAAPNELIELALSSALEFHLVDLVWQYYSLTSNPHGIFQRAEADEAEGDPGVLLPSVPLCVPSTAAASGAGKPLQIVCLSDTHRQHHQLTLPQRADLLIHSGDFTNLGSEWEVRAFDDWLRHIRPRFTHGCVVVAGNHDSSLASSPQAPSKLLPHATHYLLDSAVTIAGVRIYGAPYVLHVRSLLLDLRLPFFSTLT